MIEKVKEFMRAAGQETPEWPTIGTPEGRILRLRMLLEEVFETVSAAGINIYINDEYDRKMYIDFCSLKFENEPSHFDFVEYMDGAIDSDYILKGLFLDHAIDPEPLFNEVHENNMTKFKDGFKDPETGKWRKGPSYKPVELQPLIDAQVAGEPPWVDYKQEESPLNIPNGYYKDKKGETHYFAAGPRDKFIWKLVDGRISKGIEKSKFNKYFTKV